MREQLPGVYSLLRNKYQYNINCQPKIINYFKINKFFIKEIMVNSAFQDKFSTKDYTKKSK